MNNLPTLLTRKTTMVKSDYGLFSEQQLHDNYENIGKQVFSCLIKRERCDLDLNDYIDNLMHRIGGLNSILGEKPELITVLSLLETSKDELCFRVFRKNILDACALMYKLSSE